MAVPFAEVGPISASREIARLRGVRVSRDRFRGGPGQISDVTPGDVVSVLLRDDSAERFTGVTVVRAAVEHLGAEAQGQAGGEPRTAGAWLAGRQAEERVSNGATPWQDGPPPGRFDDDAPDPVALVGESARRERSGASPDPVDPWSGLVRPVPTDWYTTPPPQRTWLLSDSRRPNGDGVLALGKVGQMIAEGGAGKTMALAQLAVAVATGTRWLGIFDVASPGRVLMALGEEDAEEARRRLFRAARASHVPNPPPGSIVVIPLAGVTCAMLERDDRRNATEAPFLTFLRARLSSEQGWRLVIVDPLARFAGPDAETDNAAATRFMQALESLVAPSGGATILDAHHTNKFSRTARGAIEGTAGRGSSAFFDGARWECSLGAERLELEDADTRERLGEIVTWTNTKTNYSRKAEPVLLRRDLENGGALLPLDEADLETLRQARGRDPAKETKRAAKDAEQSTREAGEGAAVDRIVADRPGIPYRELLTEVMGACKCGKDRAEVIVARAANRLDVRPGPRKARLHFPKADATVRREASTVPRDRDWVAPPRTPGPGTERTEGTVPLPSTVPGTVGNGERRKDAAETSAPGQRNLGAPPAGTVIEAAGRGGRVHREAQAS